MKKIAIAAAMIITVIGCGNQKSGPATIDSTVVPGNAVVHADSPVAATSSPTLPIDSQHTTAKAPAAGKHDRGMAMSGDMGNYMTEMNQMMVKSLGAGDGNYEYRFTEEMIPHHTVAVAMATDALAKTNRPELRKLAESIIATQQQEVSQMMDWKKTWYAGINLDGIGVNPDMMKHMNSVNEMMVAQLGEKNSGYDERFINEMIPHHEGVIAMAKDALTKSHHPELKELALNMIAAQEKEIAQMKAWRQQWYGH